MADRQIFGEIMNREGNFTKTEYNIYDSICKTLLENCHMKKIIYLYCSPEKCLERVRQRNRKGEEGITLEYLKKLHDRHEEWLNRQETYSILRIDTGEFEVF